MQPDKPSFHLSYGGLFQENHIYCIPTIYPGETLYSWCARYHRISGSISAATTSQRLFGSKTAGFVVDFPGKIRHFSTATDSILGTSEELIRNHTLLPLYAAFRPHLTTEKVERLMLGDSVERVKFILGLPASRAATSHPLKFCPTCATEEFNARGIANWWQEHQWPTVWICGLHQTTLHYQNAANGPQRLTTWLTPDRLIDATRFCSAKIQESRLASLERLRHLTSLIAAESEYYRPEILRLIFTLRAMEHGWLKPSGTYDLHAIKDGFLARFGYLDSLPGFEFIRCLRGEDIGILGPMLRGSNRTQHPSKYILLIDFLFESAEQFIEHYRRHSLTENPDRHTDHLKLADVHKLDEKLTKLVIMNGSSLNNAAQTLGISVQRVITWAKRNNVEYEKRSRKTGTEFRSELNRLLEEGASRTAICEAVNVSKKWISAYLARHPDKRDKWHSKNLAQEISNRRALLLKILAINPGADQKTIRAIPGNPFQWLKRNDKDWLKNNLPFFGIKTTQ